MTHSNGFSRRRFLSGAASTAATSCLPLGGAAILTGDSVPAIAAQNTNIRASREAAATPPVIVTNSGYRLLIDSIKGTIASLQSTYGVDHELLIRDHVRLPLFMVEFMNDRAEFGLVTSSDAMAIAVHKDNNENVQTITLDCKKIGELHVDGIVKIKGPANETLTYWNLELKNGTNCWIGHVQFPVIKVPFDIHTNGDFGHILASSLYGALLGAVMPAAFALPGPSATWQAADGRIGIVRANCADHGESPRVELKGQGNKKLALYINGEQSERNVQLPSVIDVEMQSRSLTLIEVK